MDVFASLIGQLPAKRVLEAGLGTGELPQVLIFAGPDGVGRRTAATLLAQHLHGGSGLGAADTFWFAQHLEDKRSRGNTALIKATTDDMVHFLSLSPLASKHKVAIVENAGELSDEAQNALLKTLEEPRPDSLIILIVESELQLLPTIISRGKVVRFCMLGDEDMRLGLGEAATPAILQLAHGSLGRAHRLIGQGGEDLRKMHDFWNSVSEMSLADRFKWSEQMKEREMAEEFLREGIIYMRGRMLMRPDGLAAGRVESLVRTLQKVSENANVRLALDSMMVVL